MYFCVVVIIISCCVGAGFGGIITKKPRNVVASVGNTATLECCNGASNNSIQWRRVLLGRVDSNDIYLGKTHGFVDKFGDGRFDISNGNTSGCYTLIISDIQLEDAGSYRCADESDLEHSASANVTILESFACHEVFPDKEVYMGINEFELKPDMIQLMCSLKYRGEYVPEMQWKWQNSSNVSNFNAFVTNLNASSTSIATFMAAKEFDGNEIMCFVQSPGDKDLNRKIVNWTSKLYSVKYATFRNREVVNCTAEELNLECNPPCSVSSVRDNNGSNVCEISFLSETLLKRHVPIREIPHWTLAEVILGVALVVALGFVVGFLICWLRQIRVNQKLSHKLIKAAATLNSSNGKHRQDGENEPLSDNTGV